MSVASGPKAMEAQVISQATYTAIVAARSILLNGGTEDSALKTAKAAAESVLNPKGSDADTSSTRGNAFLRRRKAKRQAEVVASMALMTVSTSIRTGLSSDWSESNGGSHINPYARNITTQSMNTQDEPSVLSGSRFEPSVLSGSTRPPKAPPAQTCSSTPLPKALPKAATALLKTKFSQAATSPATTASIPAFVGTNTSRW